MAGSATDNQGRTFPLGATTYPEGANSSVFSKHSTAMELPLFERVDDSKLSRALTLDPQTNRTYHQLAEFAMDGSSPVSIGAAEKAG